MELPSYFNDMLTKIRPPQDLLDMCVEAHTELRETLVNDAELKDIVVTTFLQGSYRRSTLIRPVNGSKADVDVVLVTSLDPISWTPAQVQEHFCQVLSKDSRYRGNYRRQGRSIGISLEKISLDLVITAAPSGTLKDVLKSDAFGSGISVEAHPEWKIVKGPSFPDEDWKSEPLLIPDRDAGRWEQTDPVSQIEWTHDKNRKTDGHYVNVVKALKWWWTWESSGRKGLPKGYLVERLVGLHCPDGIESVAEGVTLVLEGIRDAYSYNAYQGTTPFIADVGIPSNNVFQRVQPDCFREFYDSVKACAAKARAAFDHPDEASSARGWIGIFGNVFPPSNNDPTSKTFQKPSQPAEPRKARFA